MSIQVLVTNFVRAMDRKKKEKESCWKREGFVSINVDAAFDFETRKGATGAIIRDKREIFLQHVAIMLIMHSIQAEALAIRYGLCLPNQIGANNVVV
jgi:hypothetical protein